MGLQDALRKYQQRKSTTLAASTTHSTDFLAKNKNTQKVVTGDEYRNTNTNTNTNVITNSSYNVKDEKEFDEFDFGDINFDEFDTGLEPSNTNSVGVTSHSLNQNHVADKSTVVRGQSPAKSKDMCSESKADLDLDLDLGVDMGLDLGINNADILAVIEQTDTGGNADSKKTETKEKSLVAIKAPETQHQNKRQESKSVVDLGLDSDLNLELDLDLDFDEIEVDLSKKSKGDDSIADSNGGRVVVDLENDDSKNNKEIYEGRKNKNVEIEKGIEMSIEKQPKKKRRIERKQHLDTWKRLLAECGIHSHEEYASLATSGESANKYVEWTIGRIKETLDDSRGGVPARIIPYLLVMVREVYMGETGTCKVVFGDGLVGETGREETICGSVDSRFFDVAGNKMGIGSAVLLRDVPALMSADSSVSVSRSGEWCYLVVTTSTIHKIYIPGDRDERNGMGLSVDRAIEL
ncbi:hypothetical protein AX774_g7322 [Zancudomyces culisetae]|uniref:Uncharacterized protein n=1 Tax=Zancudomyces culisetae TaxID=1213189 RepID=A0A1R1PC76_ZANCU|nr:hypothetical protein AX774_g8049 [Zancudomyces culisetae]OMH79272.1 hypothetical protein AX774_g7322 [Zancudomyces culisetae]|eukprot:OMH78560.1 hypothetical protein AX774_g8049 [Zancudomyces culisetae]